MWTRETLYAKYIAEAPKGANSDHALWTAKTDVILNALSHLRSYVNVHERDLKAYWWTKRLRDSAMYDAVRWGILKETTYKGRPAWVLTKIDTV